MKRYMIINACLAALCCAYRLAVIMILQHEHAISLAHWTYVFFIAGFSWYAVALVLNLIGNRALWQYYLHIMMPPFLTETLFVSFGVVGMIFHNSDMLTSHALTVKWGTVYLADHVVHHFALCEILLWLLLLKDQWKWPRGVFWRVYFVFSFVLPLILYSTISEWTAVYGIDPMSVPSTTATLVFTVAGLVCLLFFVVCVPEICRVKAPG